MTKEEIAPNEHSPLVTKFSTSSQNETVICCELLSALKKKSYYKNVNLYHCMSLTANVRGKNKFILKNGIGLTYLFLI